MSLLRVSGVIAGYGGGDVLQGVDTVVAVPLSRDRAGTVRTLAEAVGG